MEDVEIKINNIYKDLKKNWKKKHPFKKCISYKDFRKKVELETNHDVHVGLKTYQFQLLAHTSSQGQTPFTSNVLNLREAQNEHEQKDLAFLIEEMLKRRIKGVTDKNGLKEAPLFPKLLYYVCDGLNLKPSDPYYYLTELAAKCMSTSMQPDIISEKKNREAKHGQIIPCMGAARGDETVSIKIDDIEYNNIPIAEAYIKLRNSNKKHGSSFKDINKSDITDLWNVVGVYKITHKPTGKYYIGSSKNVGRRLNEHSYSIKNKGSLGDNYYIGDFNKDNYKRELLESCNLDDLLDVEFKYIDLTDENCVNKKDLHKNGNFDTYTRNLTLNHKKYSTYDNKDYTVVKDVDGVRCFIKRKGEWTPIRKITYNDPNRCNLKLFKVTYQKNRGEKNLYITEDHPLLTQRGRTKAIDLKLNDIIYDAISFEEYKIVHLEEVNNNVPTYDFEVDNDMFDLSGILSYNCRSFLQGIWIEKEYPIETKFYWQEIDDTNVQYDGAPGKNFNYKKGFGTYSKLPKDKNIVINFRGNSGWIKEFKINDKGEEVVVITEPKVYGRFNAGVITINVPHTALEARKEVNEEHNFNDMNFHREFKKEYKERFFKIFTDRLEICHEGLKIRYEAVCKIKAKNSPILWQYGALTRLDEEASIGDWIKSHEPDFTSISLGYIGLYETCQTLIDESNTTSNGQMLSKEILQFMNETMKKWREDDHIGYSIYGTPEETLTASASRALKRDFGLVEKITDHDYVTNSYHVNPAEKIDAWNKLKIEGQYLQLSPGGAVSYIEVPDMKKNTKVLEDVIQYMYDNIMYAEVNSRIDVCWNCSYQGELEMIKTTNGKFVFKCPNCGCTDPNKQRVTRRICGYMGTVNSGNTNFERLSDIYDRVLHLGND